MCCDEEDPPAVILDPLPGDRRRVERRGTRRVRPPMRVYGRVASITVLLVDVSESGARVEHCDGRLQIGSTVTLEACWEASPLAIECSVVASRVHEVIPGDTAVTVYRSGIHFERVARESRKTLTRIVNQVIARGLVEQMANARGIGPVMQRDMPTFRDGLVDDAGHQTHGDRSEPADVPGDVFKMARRGFIRYRKIGGCWEKHWTIDPRQPRDGFVILATESEREVQLLCDTWDAGDPEVKRLVHECARSSIHDAIPHIPA